MNDSLNRTDCLNETSKLDGTDDLNRTDGQRVEAVDSISSTSTGKKSFNGTVPLSLLRTSNTSNSTNTCPPLLPINLQV